MTDRLRAAAKALLSDIDAGKDASGEYLYGPFTEGTLNEGANYELFVSWPNLVIAADELRAALKERPEVISKPLMKRRLKVGDRVVYSSSHHAHNKHLQEHLGEAGEVLLYGCGSDSDKLLVQFERTSDIEYGRFWIGERYLRKEDQDADV